MRARQATRDELEAIREAMKAGLVHPETAQYRGIKVAPDGTIGGQVNAQAQAGNFLGFRQFVGLVHPGLDSKPTVLIIGVDWPDRPGRVAYGMCRQRGLA